MVKKKKKNPIGRPRINIDYDQLEQLCKIHCTGDECAAVLGISYASLNVGLKRDGHKSFLEYNKIYSNQGKASLRRVQWKKAIRDENVPMIIWLSRNYLGQTDKHDIGDGDDDIDHYTEFLG